MITFRSCIFFRNTYRWHLFFLSASHQKALLWPIIDHVTFNSLAKAFFKKSVFDLQVLNSMRWYTMELNISILFLINLYSVILASINHLAWNNYFHNGCKMLCLNLLCLLHLFVCLLTCSVISLELWNCIKWIIIHYH